MYSVFNWGGQRALAATTYNLDVDYTICNADGSSEVSYWSNDIFYFKTYINGRRLYGSAGTSGSDGDLSTDVSAGSTYEITNITVNKRGYTYIGSDKPLKGTVNSNLSIMLYFETGHNHLGSKYEQNASQHRKYTYCTWHFGDTSQNRSYSSWENHTWVTTKDWYNYDNTTMHQDQKCSVCGYTRTNSKSREYSVNFNTLHPTKGEPNDFGRNGWAYMRISTDNKNWSNECTDYIIYNRPYGSKLYVQYIRPIVDYLEFGNITAKTSIENCSNNTWCYTVSNAPSGEYTGGYVNINLQYKHTTLTLDPNGGMINGSSDKQALSPQMQYSMSNWWSISGKKPTRPGYTFEGWYDAATGGTKVYDTDGKCIRDTKYWDSNGNSLCVNDLTVYAHWKINTYNIYYTLYGSNASLQRTYTVESNNFALPTAPTLQGYTFKGWIGGIDQKDPVKKGSTYQTPTKNITVEKGSRGDYFFRAIFEKTHSVSDGINTDDVYIAQSIPHEKQY